MRSGLRASSPAIFLSVQIFRPILPAHLSRIVFGPAENLHPLRTKSPPPPTLRPVSVHMQIFQRIESTPNFSDQLDGRIMPGTKHVPR